MGGLGPPNHPAVNADVGTTTDAAEALEFCLPLPRATYNVGNYHSSRISFGAAQFVGYHDDF